MGCAVGVRGTTVHLLTVLRAVLSSSPQKAEREILLRWIFSSLSRKSTQIKDTSNMAAVQRVDQEAVLAVIFKAT